MSLLRGFLRILPGSMRLSLYRYFVRTVTDSGPAHVGPSTVRLLRFGLCLKQGRPMTMKNEANALCLVEKCTTSVPAPKLVDFVMEEDGEAGFILMTRVPGERLDTVLYRMTLEERRQLGHDLGQCISEWRCIPNNSQHQIANTTGGPVFDHRFEDKHCGPFDSDTAFNDCLTVSVEKKRHESRLSALYKEKHGVYFTHSDLDQTNVFVQAGQLSGIIDWEHAGFKPEYWEYTKALWPSWAHKDQKEIFAEAFEKDYEEELEAEKFLWRVQPVI